MLHYAVFHDIMPFFPAFCLKILLRADARRARYGARMPRAARYF